MVPDLTRPANETTAAGWNADTAIDELQRRGLTTIPCGDLLGMQTLAGLFNTLPVRQMFEGAPEEQYSVDWLDGTATFAVASSAVSDRMRWLWASDEQTLSMFDGVSEHCLNTLRALDERPMMLYSACFVVVRGEYLHHDETSRHVDWGHAKLPKGSAFTCLAPLVALPESVGGLQYWPWDDVKAYGRVTSLNMNAPFVQHIYKYELGHYAAIDGRLFHRTEPFEYHRSEAEPELCRDFEACGHLRVLVSLSIASSEERLARYARKILQGMTPASALVRQSDHIYVHSDSACCTSDSDSDCEENLGLMSLRCIFQSGNWCGQYCYESEGWSNALDFSADLRFNLRKGVIHNIYSEAGSLFLEDGFWCARLQVDLGSVGQVQILGRFVQSTSSVCFQGCVRAGPHSVYVIISPPRPWYIPWARWKQFPLPAASIGLPVHAGAVRLSFRHSKVIDSPINLILGTAASWNADCADLSHSQAFEGVLVVFGADPTDEELANLTANCIVVVPDSSQRRGTLDRVLAAMLTADASLLLSMQRGRATIPRGMRGPEGSLPGVAPGFTANASCMRPIIDEMAGQHLLVCCEVCSQEVDRSR